MTEPAEIKFELSDKWVHSWGHILRTLNSALDMIRADQRATNADIELKRDNPRLAQLSKIGDWGELYEKPFKTSVTVTMLRLIPPSLAG